MKKIILTALAATIAISPALAGPSASGSNGLLEKRTGQKAVTFSYISEWSCNETRHARFETISCTLDAPLPEGAYSVYSGNWISDFTGETGTFTFTISDDGLTYSGRATY